MPWIEVPCDHAAMRAAFCFQGDQDSFTLSSMLIYLVRGVDGVRGMILARGMLLPVRVLTRALPIRAVGPDPGGVGCSGVSIHPR